MTVVANAVSMQESAAEMLCERKNIAASIKVGPVTSAKAVTGLQPAVTVRVGGTGS